MKFLQYFVFLFFVLSHSQNNSKYSNEFMNIGVDASSISMSGAVTSSINDVNSGYWNPAGLTAVEQGEISLMHSNYFANIANYNYVAYAKPIDNQSAIGLSMIRFGVDDILDTTQLIDDQGNINYDRINLFSAVDYGFIISYARKMLTKEISYGINTKIIRRIIGDFASSWGFGLDIGLQLKTSNNWRFGLMARDISTTYNSWSINETRLIDIQNAIDGQNQDIPNSTEITIPKIQLGISKLHNINYEYSLLTSFDLIMKFEENNNLISSEFVSINPAIGLELGYTDSVFLRLGIGNFQNEIGFDNSTNLTFQPNFGLGFKFNNLEIDYAFTDIGDQSVALYSNIFSLKIDFDIFR
ncbi:PorV/PorQ family protein [Flavobacteriaceae bacterium]|nr:PorV/PorQ family protein [Flavobacteriaceae bacterium]